MVNLQPLTCSNKNTTNMISNNNNRSSNSPSSDKDSTSPTTPFNFPTNNNAPQLPNLFYHRNHSLITNPHYFNYSHYNTMLYPFHYPNNYYYIPNLEQHPSYYPQQTLAFPAHVGGPYVQGFGPTKVPRGPRFTDKNGYGRRKWGSRSGKGNGGGAVVKKVWRVKGKNQDSVQLHAYERNNQKSCQTHPYADESESESASPAVVEWGKCTTVMIRNIPNCLRKELIEMLDSHCLEQNQKEENSCLYDFVYLPFDFRYKRSNMGYAFVNMTTMEGALSLYSSWNRIGWRNSKKIRVISRAKLQGIEKCKQHFRATNFACNSDDFLPVEFIPARNGSNADASEMRLIGRRVRLTDARREGKKGHRPPRLDYSSGKSGAHPPRLN